MGNTEAPLSSLSQQSSQMPISHLGRKLRSNSVSPSAPKSNRTGDVLDSLVVMIAMLLIPAWLLGHLFLTFYPAPEGVAGAELGGTEASQPADGDSESKSPTDPDSDMGTGSGDKLGEMAMGDGSNGMGGSSAALQSMKDKFNSLTQTSATLESEVMSLKESNAALVQQNEALKTKANQHVMSFKKPAEDNSKALQELQIKYDNTSFELQSMQQKLESTENEKQTLQMNLADAQSKLEQAQAMQAKPDAAADTPFALLGSEEKSKQDELVAEANAKVTALQQQIEELNRSMANSKNSMAAQQEELQTARRQVQDAMAQNANLKTALNTARENAARDIAAARDKAASEMAARDKAAAAREMAAREMAAREQADREQAAREQAMAAEKPKEEFRDYTSSKGSVSRMAFIRWEGDDVIVRSFANKKLYRLTMDRFSEADQQYLLERRK